MTKNKNKGATHPHKNGKKKESDLKQGEMTDEEREIIGMDEKNSTKKESGLKHGEMTDEEREIIGMDEKQGEMTDEEKELYPNYLNDAHESLEKNITNLMDTISFSDALKQNNMLSYYTNEYNKYKQKAYDEFKHAQTYYQSIRKDREHYIKLYKMEGVDISKFENKKIKLIEDMRKEQNDEKFQEIAAELVSIRTAIKDADDNIDKFCSKRYVKEKSNAKDNYNVARKKYKEVRETKKEIINNLKEIDKECNVSEEQLDARKWEALIGIQECMNILTGLGEQATDKE